MDENTNSFVVTERLLDGSEKQTMERVLAYRSEPLAAVYLEADATDCTIAWPVITGINLAELFDGYYEFVGDAETSIEWWVGDKFFERSLSHREEIGLAARDLREQEKRLDVPLDLVQLVCTDLVFEVNLGGIEGPAPATSLAIAVPSVSGKLLRLFSRFHRNEFVRARPDAAYSALRAIIGEGFQRLRKN